MEKGLIPFAAVQQAFKQATSEGGRFDNMLGKIAETPAGKVQQLSGAWDEFKISAGAALMPLVSMALDFASSILPIIEGVIPPLTTGVQNIVGWIHQASGSTGVWMSYLTPIVDLFRNHYLPLLTTTWNVIKNIGMKLGEFVSRSELLKDIFSAVATFAGMLYDVVSFLVESLGWLFDNVVMPILNGIESAYRFLKGSDNKGKALTPDKPDKPLPTRPDKPDKPSGITPTTVLQQSVTPIVPASTYDPSDKIKGVAGGGSRPTNITVNLNKEMVGQITINPVTMSQGADEVKTLMMQALAQVLNSANRLAFE